MKKNFYLPFVIFLLAFQGAQAQNEGCDGSRYKNDVFTAVKKTTVVYAPTMDHLNSPVNLQMDVYEPEGDLLAKRPVVVLAHGGSFLFGDRTQMDRWCRLLAKKGYVAATISYRLYPFFVLGLPDSLKIFDTAVKAVGDMRAAVRYFREDAATLNQFHADADHIFIGGYSAGAVTALHCAYLDVNDDMPAFLQTIVNNNGGLEGISGTPSNKTYSASSLATVNMSGGLYRNAWIDDSETPLVSIHGTADQTVPYVAGLAANIAYLQGSSLLHGRANDIGLWNSLHTVPGGGHTDIYDNASYQPHIDTFWVNATTLLESLTCATVGTFSPDLWDNNWAISPNPILAGQGFRVELPTGITEAGVNVINTLGELVFQQQNISSGREILLPNLPKGVYFVQLSNANGSSQQYAAKKLLVE